MQAGSVMCARTCSLLQIISTATWPCQYACLLAAEEVLLQLPGMHCRGKDQPSYSPSMDMGGYVIIINSEKVTVTGDKVNQKLYRNHRTARPGTLKTETFKQLNQVSRCSQPGRWAVHAAVDQNCDKSLCG